MANVAITPSAAALDTPGSHLPRRLRAILRWWQRQQLRRRALRELLADARDQHLLSDVHFVTPRQHLAAAALRSRCCRD